MKKIIFILLAFISFNASAQNTGSLPYWQIMLPKASVSGTDSCAVFDQSTLKWKKIKCSTLSGTSVAAGSGISITSGTKDTVAIDISNSGIVLLRDGSRTATGALDMNSHNITKVLIIKDHAGTSSVDVDNRQLYDASGNTIADWSNKANGFKVQSGSFSGALKTSLLSAPTAYELPASTGTLALVSQIPSSFNLTGPISSSGNVTSITSQTGTGTTFVVQTSPTLTTPNLGTPSTLVGTNITGTGIGFTAGNVTTNANLTGPITSVGNATSIASQTGTGTTFVMNTSPILVTPNLGTPTTLIGTNITGTASGLTAGSVTTNANLTGPITSVGNTTSIASQTGTGNTFVMQTSPTLTTPNLGTPTTLIGTNITGTGSGFTSGTCTTIPALSSEVSNSGNAVTLVNSAVIGKVLTGYTSGTGTVSATDNILQAIQKLNGNTSASASQWTTTGSDIYYNTGNVMIGSTSTPSGKLQTIETSITSPRGVFHDQYNTGVMSSQLNMRKARGTFASPTTIVTGDILSNFNIWAYDGTNFLNAGAIRTTSVGTVAATRTAAKMEFMTMTDVTPSVLTTALTLDQSQNAQFAGTITSGTWNGSVVGPTYGGTGVNNASKTITLGGNLATTGAFNLTVAVPQTTTYTLPNTTNETLAGLGTAQTFTAQQSYTNNIIPTATNTYTVGENTATGDWSNMYVRSIQPAAVTTTNTGGNSIIINSGVGNGSGATTSISFGTPTTLGAGAGPQSITNRVTINNASLTVSGLDILTTTNGGSKLGSSSNTFNNVFTNNITSNLATALTLTGSDQGIAIATPVRTGTSSLSSGALSIKSGNATGASSANLSGDITVATGNVTSATGTSGSINITPGTSGGTRGKVIVTGCVDGSSAASGIVGEVIPHTTSSYTNYTTTATYQAIDSISLTAGDWDISGSFTYSSNAATLTAASNVIFVISTTKASAAGAVEGDNIFYISEAALLATSKSSGTINANQVTISATTKYYLNSQATFTVGNPQYVGKIRARRMR